MGVGTEEPLIWFAADTPASLLVTPDEDAAQQMKDISGRKCIDWYERLGRDGLLPRMLLAMLNLVSTKLPHRWKLMGTPSGHLLFRLQPLTQHTGETGSGSSAIPASAPQLGIDLPRITEGHEEQRLAEMLRTENGDAK